MSHGIAAGSWRSARKECHWKLAGRPKGMPFSSGRTGTTGTTETAGKWQAMLPRLAIGLCEGNACAPSHWPARSPRAYFEREAPPRHNPGGLGGPGGPGGPGSRRQSREAARAYLSHRPVALPCAAKMAAFPVKLRAQALTGTAAFQAAAFPATGPPAGRASGFTFSHHQRCGRAMLPDNGSRDGEFH